MKKIYGLLPVLLAAYFSFAIAIAEARNFVSVKSSYLGDGWFSYEVRMEPNPFFSTQIMAFAGTYPFSGRIDSTLPPEGWTAGTNSEELSWTKNNQTEPHALPFEFTMVGRSSSSGFRTETNTFRIGFLLWLYDGFQSPLVSENIAGYATLPVLVPCDPYESDGSPLEIFSGYEFLPDPQVVELGSDFLRYSWPNTNTVVIEASHDLHSWSNLAQTVGHGGTTTWSAVQSLGTFGRYFRVGLVATRALPEKAIVPATPPLTSVGIFNRLTPEGLIVSGPNGTTLIPAGQADHGLWHLPVSLPQ